MASASDDSTRRFRGARSRVTEDSTSQIQPSNLGSTAASNPESTGTVAISSNGSSSSASSAPPTQIFVAANQVVNFGNNASVQVNQSRKSKKEKIGANYNSRMSLDLLINSIGRNRVEGLMALAEGKSVRQFYLDLLGANNNLANVMYLDLFPLLHSVGVPANFAYFASIFRSSFRLANPQDPCTDEYMLSDGLPDKRLYETMRQRILGLKEILNDVAGPELIAELGKGLEFSKDRAGKLKVDARKSIVFPIGPTGVFEYKADRPLLERLKVPNEGYANYICHGLVLHLILKGVAHFLGADEVKNLILAMEDTEAGVSKLKFNSTIKLANFSLLLALIIPQPDKDVDLYLTVKSLTLYLNQNRDVEKRWGGYDKNLFKLPLVENEEDEEYKRLKLVSESHAEESIEVDVSWTPSDDE